MFWEKLKEAVKNFFVWLGILVLAGGAVFWQKNRLPEEAVLLDEKIRATTPLLLNQERKEVLAEFDEFVLAGAEKDWGEKPSLINFFFSPGRKLFDQRCALAVGEVKESEVKEGKTKLWFLYNMGVVLKTEKTVIAFDLGQPWLSDCYGELAETVDLVLTSHAHSDHFDPVFLAQAHRAGATLIFPENCYLKTKLEKENPQAKGKIFNLISGEEREEKGVKIKAFQTDHRGDGNFKLPVAWFWVETEGLEVLHTGDGREFKNQAEYRCTCTRSCMAGGL